MPITESQDERLTLLLQGLEPCCKELSQSSRKFVEEQIARHDQYGSRIFMSPKQWAWLEDLYKKHVGDTLEGDDDHRDAEQSVRDDIREDSLTDDLKDDIPF